MAEVIQINHDTWRIEDNGVRFFLLEGDKKALLIDSGMNTPEARKIAEEITPLPVELLNTHADRDHISGNAAFEACYMSEAEEENYRAAGGTTKIIPVSDGDVLDLGNRPLKIIALPGHTPGSIAVLDVKLRVLISGDPIQDGRIFMFGKFRNMEKYIESMKALSAYDRQYDLIYPSHGSFPVGPSLPARLVQDAQDVLDGKYEGKEVDMFGRKAVLYTTPDAGFLCDH